MLDKSANAGRAPLSERGDDLYETPSIATETLFRVEEFPDWYGNPRVALALLCAFFATTALMWWLLIWLIMDVLEARVASIF